MERNALIEQKTVKIIDNISGIDNVTGANGDFELAHIGFYNFLLEITAVASGAVDALNVNLYPLQLLDNPGSDSKAFIEASAQILPANILRWGASGTIANTTSALKYIQLFTDQFWPALRLQVKSAGATDTWTVTARLRRIRIGNSRPVQFMNP